MKKFYKIFFGIIWILLSILFIIPSTRNIAFAVVIFFPLGSVIGSFMFLSYPFSVSNKIIYILALIFAISLITTGIIKRKKKVGHFFIIFGILLWGFLGLIGLGTGT